MPFQLMFTGFFTGSIAATFAFSQGGGLGAALLSYSLFGVIAVLGMGLLVVLAPRSVVATRLPRLFVQEHTGQPFTRRWVASNLRTRGQDWQTRLERMAEQAGKPVSVCVFSSVRDHQGSVKTP